MVADLASADTRAPAARQQPRAMTLFPGVAFITGAGSGIGRQTAVSFAAEGCCQIAIADRDPVGLEETKALIAAVSDATEVLVLPMDVRLDDDIVSAIETVISRFQRIDYAVHCAGTFGPEAASVDLRPDEFDNVMAINCRGVWMCSREVTKRMKLQDPLPTHDGRPGYRGSVVNIASNLGFVCLPGKTPYDTSKAAVMHMTKSDALDCAPHKIRMNCVAPGMVDTPFTSDIPNDSSAVHAIPMRRKGSPQEIADVILFVSSNKASYMQGSVTLVDGGHSIP